MTAIDDIASLVNRISPLLAGWSPETQGAVIADLTAIWLAGHVCIGDPEETAKLRDELLRHHVAAVRELIPPNAKAMGTGPMTGKCGP